MAFATAEEVGTRLGRDLTDAEVETVELLLEGATAVIAAAGGLDDAEAAALSPVPKVLWIRCIELTAQAMANPSGLANLSEGLGDYNYAARFRDLGMELTELQERAIRRALGGTASGSSRPKSILGDFLPEAS